MFCIAAFIIFAILSLFSASYRPLAKKAWHCTWRRITFRPCDISFGEEVKGRLIAKLILKHPRMARFIDRWSNVIAFFFVALSIWSLVYVFNAGLNLWVYDTCNPASAESCSLSGEACGVNQNVLTLRQAIVQGRLGTWVAGPFTRFADTVSRIPDRLRTWEATDYLAPRPTYLAPFDAGKPTALEIIDPGCKFCKKLTRNLIAAGVPDRANVSYLLYPIPTASGGTKFPHSLLVASTIEAAKRVPLAGSQLGAPGDWRLIEAIFADPTDGSDVDLQTKINIGMTRKDVVQTLRQLLADIGYRSDQVAQIEALATSPDIAAALQAQKSIVEQRVRTIKIPTLLIGSRRFDRVVDVQRLQGL